MGRLEESIADFAVSSNPDRLIVADEAGQTHTWTNSPEGLHQDRVIQKPETAPSGLLADPTGRWLGGNPGEDSHLRLWDLSSLPASRPLALRRSDSWYGAMKRFHPRGEWVVASTSTYSRLTFWPLGRTYPSVVDGYSGLTRPLAFSPDGKWLATSWADLRIRLWPLPGSGATEVRSLELPEASATYPIFSISFDPKGSYLFAAGNQDRAWIVPLDGASPRKMPVFSEDTLFHAGAVSPSGRLVATAFAYGRGDKTLRVWDVETGELRRFDLPGGSRLDANEPATGYEQGIRSLGFVNESTLYSAGDGGLVRWNVENGSYERVASTLPGGAMSGPIRAERGAALTFERPLGQTANCPRALLHDLTGGTSREVTGFGECSAWGNFSVALDPSGTVAATGSTDGIVRVGRLSGREPHLLLGHVGAIDFIAISADLRWVATTGEDNTLRLWPMPDLSKPPLHTLPHDELLAKLRSLTNFRAVRDPSSATGWNIELGPFPGWKHVPTW